MIVQCNFGFVISTKYKLNSYTKSMAEMENQTEWFMSNIEEATIV